MTTLTNTIIKKWPVSLRRGVTLGTHEAPSYQDWFPAGMLVRVGKNFRAGSGFYVRGRCDEFVVGDNFHVGDSFFLENAEHKFEVGNNFTAGSNVEIHGMFRADYNCSVGNGVVMKGGVLLSGATIGDYVRFEKKIVLEENASVANSTAIPIQLTVPAGVRVTHNLGCLDNLWAFLGEGPSKEPLIAHGRNFIVADDWKTLETVASKKLPSAEVARLNYAGALLNC